MKMPLFSILIFIILNINMVCSIKLSLTYKLTVSNIEQDCTYKLAGEKVISVSISKDSQIFLEYTEAQKTPKFTQIPGIYLVSMQGGCKVTIRNPQTTSYGLYQMAVKYKDKKGVIRTEKIKKKLSAKYDKCQAKWVNATKDKIPAKSWVAGTNKDGDNVYVCRAIVKDKGRYLMGFVLAKGSTNSACQMNWGEEWRDDDSFEMLTGQGFQWALEDGFSNHPTNSLLVGQDSSNPPGNLYVGRFHLRNSSYIGKITDGCYYKYVDATGGHQDNNCDQHEILLC